MIMSLSPWYGAKRLLGKKIVEEFGPHRIYWEPFCGSMAVLMNKPPTVMETVNDLHGDLINLARIIKDRELAPLFYRRLRRILMHEDLFREAAQRYHTRGQLPSGAADLERAFDYFICAWMGRNGVAGTTGYNQGFCRRFTARGGHTAKRWNSVVNSIPAWRKRLCNVTILNQNGIELIKKIDDAPGTIIYCDPPYFVKGAKYMHDFEYADHEELARELHRFQRARILVSYYENPLLNQLYPQWTKRELFCSKSLSLQNKREGKPEIAPEVLLINGPSYGNKPQILTFEFANHE